MSTPETTARFDIFPKGVTMSDVKQREDLAASPLRYVAEGHHAPGRDAELIIGTNRIVFDGTASPGSELPGPADLLAAALAACILKNVDRFSGMLPFAYTRADVRVELTREEAPARISRAHYVLTIETDEPEHRLDLLHRNILQFGTITNTLAAACDLSGEIRSETPRLHEGS